MRIRCSFPRSRQCWRTVGRLSAVSLLILSLFCSALAETVPAFYNPQNPPPYAAYHAASGDDYFTDAVFIGDSMMECVEMYGFFPSAKIVCKSGITSVDANWRIFHITQWDQPRNIYEMIEYYGSTKIYIWLGSNSLDNVTSDEALRDYRGMIEEMIQCFPNALIYVITPPSLTKKAMQAKKLGVLRYYNFRKGLLKIAEEYKLYFLDYYAQVVNDEGYLIDIYDGGDGGHPSRRGVKVLENLVRTHTVEFPAAQ